MTDDTVGAHIVAAMLGLDAAERAAAGRAGWDSVEEWSLAWGGVVTAQRALSAAAGPYLEAQAASLDSLEAGECVEYLRACLWALETLGPQVDMPGLMVARATIEDVARQVAAISARESAPSGSGDSWRRLTAALLARGVSAVKGSPQLHPNQPQPHRQMPGSTRTAVELAPGPVHHTSRALERSSSQEGRHDREHQ